MGRYDHLCPGCRREIKWCLLYCADCRWRGKGGPNPTIMGVKEEDDEV